MLDLIAEDTIDLVDLTNKDLLEELSYIFETETNKTLTISFKNFSKLPIFKKWQRLVNTISPFFLTVVYIFCLSLSLYSTVQVYPCNS